MRPKPTSIRLAVCAALGIVAVAPAAQAAAPVLPNGVYQATINPTPLKTPTPSGIVIPGTDGAWNSTFSFSHLPSKKSQAMEDNKVDFTCGAPSGTCGSSVLGKGAGSWDMTVTGGTFTTSNFQVDAIMTTAGGTFVEYGSLNGGTITQTGTDAGAVTLNTTGRLGSVSNFSSTLFDEPWNIPDAGHVAGALGTAYAPLTTSSSTNPNGTVTGHTIVSNGNGTYNVILVSASQVGVSWGGFDTNPYVETWNVTLKPLLIVKDDTAAAQPGVAKLIDVKANDTIASGVTPTIVLLPSTEKNGATLAVSSGKVSYTALSTFTGTDTFQYELKDSKGDVTLPATVTVTVASGVTAVKDTASTAQGKAVTISVLVNDVGLSDATVTIATSPGHGSATASGSKVIYTPKSGFVGTDTFQYTATAGGKSSTAIVTVTVKAGFQAATSGVSVGPGKIAINNKSSGLVTTQQLAAAGISVDSGVSSQCIGGCFDFKATGVGSGGQAKVVMLPLSKPIPSGARLRKYIKLSKKWQDFDTSNGDSMASAPGSATSCPPPSASYQTGLVAGDYCVRLTITDGGKNDGDGLANGTITDPSGIATVTAPSATPTPANLGLGSGGCALGTDANPWHGGSWWIIGSMIGWLGFTRRRRSSRQS